MTMPAGWYTDPTGSKRYWDGAAWVEAPIEAEPVQTERSASLDVLPVADARTKGGRGRLVAGAVRP